MTTKDTASIALISLAALFWAGQKLWNYWKSRNSELAKTIATSEIAAISSDSPPPEGTIAFNAAILKACGSIVDDEFKLKLLSQSDITIAKALELSRIEVETLHKPKTNPKPEGT